MPPEPSKGPLKTIGPYVDLQLIAEGGMGAVYKARHSETNAVVALKIVPPATARNEVLMHRFKLEFEAAKSLDIPNIVKAIEYCADPPTPYLVMEYVDGMSLGQRIDRFGPMKEDDAIRIVAQIAQGLFKAHKQKLIHRDIKPDNILVTSDGTAKLTDLGLVKRLDVENGMDLTRTGKGLGTPHFMAPEQFRNAKNVDVRCDIYSLGATLYMMVTGKVPFGDCGPLDAWMKKIRNDYEPPRKLKASISERVDWAIRRSMSADPERRPANCKEFVEDLIGQQLRAPSAPAPQGVDSAIQEVWYLVYKDEEGESHTVKGTSDGIRRALRDSLLGDAYNIKACRHKQGPFLGLREFPEFRPFVVEPANTSSGLTRAVINTDSSDDLRPLTTLEPPPPPPMLPPEDEPEQPTVRSNRPHLPPPPALRPPSVEAKPVPPAAPSNNSLLWAVIILLVILVLLIGAAIVILLLRGK
jgi:serine/threonine protein kinase